MSDLGAKRPRSCAGTGRLTRMDIGPMAAPTLTALGTALPRYGAFRFDRTLAAAREDIGDQPDLANRDNAVWLRKWLNDWTCRIGYPQAGQDDKFCESLATWQASVTNLLPESCLRLAQLEDPQIHAIGRAYGCLYLLPAAVGETGQVRRIGPTAAAKLLYFVRPVRSHRLGQSHLCPYRQRAR